MSLPLFLTRNHGTLFLVKKNVRVGLRKVVENQAPVSQFVPASWASVRNRLCIRQVDVWVCLYILSLIQESEKQTKHSKIWICLCPLSVTQEGGMQVKHSNILVCLCLLSLIQGDGLQIRHSNIWVCFCLSKVIQEGAMQASTLTSELVFVS